MIKILCKPNEKPSDFLVFNADNVNDPRWNTIISILKANIPGFEVRYADYNWMNFYIPGGYDEVDDDYYEGVVEATNIRFFNPERNFVDVSIPNDEVQFDTHDEEELAELWWQFCKENDLITINQGMADWVTGEWV